MLVFLSGESAPCLAMSVLSDGSFEHVQKFPGDKTDREDHLMFGHCVAYTPHKPIARALSIRGD